jgi:hypothetical protein
VWRWPIVTTETEENDDLRAEDADDQTPWPPPPHDPRERRVVGHVERWEVRAFPRSDPRYAYFAARGLWHIQLWDPISRVSILTPSRLTLGRYEVFPVRGWKALASDHDELTKLFAGHERTLPSAATLTLLQRWFVEGVEREVARGPAMDTALRTSCREIR